MKIINILVISLSLIFGYLSNKEKIDQYTYNTTNEFITQMSDVADAKSECVKGEVVYEFQLKQINVYAEWPISYGGSIDSFCNEKIDVIKTPIVGLNVKSIEPIEDIKIALNLI